jgi:hypothetical protein
MYFDTKWRKIFESATDEVNGEFTLLYNEERHNLYRTTNIVRIAKLWLPPAGLVARMSSKEMHSEC